MNKYDTLTLDPAIMQEFHDNAEKHKQHTRLKALLSAYTALALSYGLVAYFVVKTLLDALMRIK